MSRTRKCYRWASCVVGLLILSSCTQETDHDNSTENDSGADAESTAERPVIGEAPSDGKGPASADAVSKSLGPKSNWEIVVILERHGEYAVFGSGGAELREDGSTVRLGVDYDLPGRRMHLIVSDYATYLGVEGRPWHWVDFTNSIGLPGVMTNAEFASRYDYVESQPRKSDSDTFRIFVKPGQVYWQDSAGVIRRRISTTRLIAGDDLVSVITVRDRVEEGVVPTWFVGDLSQAGRVAVPAAAVIRANAFRSGHKVFTRIEEEAAARIGGDYTPPVFSRTSRVGLLGQLIDVLIPKAYAQEEFGREIHCPPGTAAKSCHLAGDVPWVRGVVPCGPQGSLKCHGRLVDPESVDVVACPPGFPSGAMCLDANDENDKVPDPECSYLDGTAPGCFKDDREENDGWGRSLVPLPEISGPLGNLGSDDEGDADGPPGDWLDNLPSPGKGLGDALGNVGSDAIDGIGGGLGDLYDKLPFPGQGLGDLDLPGSIDNAGGPLICINCSWNSTTVHGDPHITTFDKHRYGFQATGEFVYVQAPQFEVQQRFEGLKGVNTMAKGSALRVGNHIVESYVELTSNPNRDGTVSVIIDGVLVKLDFEGINFDDGGFIRRHGDAKYNHLIFVDARGSYVIVENHTGTQTVQISLTEEIKALVGGGLGGVPDGNKSNDFTLRDGSELGVKESETIEGLYGKFAASWRVRPEERLFTQGNAEDYLTAEYTDLPQTVTKLSDFSQTEIDNAQEICIDAGVSRGAPLEDCTYDVLASGDPAWAQAAASSSIVRAMSEPPTPRGAMQRATGVFSSPESVQAGTVMSFDWKGPAAKDDIIFIGEREMGERRYKKSNVHTATDGSPAILVAPVTPGSYEIRYFSYADGVVAFRKSIEVTAAEVTFDVPAEVVAGTEFDVEWTGPKAKDDFLFVAELDMKANAYFIDNGINHEADAGSPADLIAPTKAGDYEIRYFSRANGKPLAAHPLHVLPPVVSIEAPDSVAAESDFDISWKGPNAKDDFIFIAKPKMTESQYYIGAGYRTEEGPRGTLKAPTEPGPYEIRYFSRRNGSALATRPVLVVSAAASADENAPYVIKWPDGWEITHPAIKVAEGFDGKRVRATRRKGNEPAAAMELIYLPLNPGHSLRLDDEFSGMLETLIEPFEAGGMTTEIEEKTGQLAGLPARIAQLTASGSGVIVNQWIAMTLSDSYIYSFSFSGPETEFNGYWDEFQKAVRTLELR